MWAAAETAIIIIGASIPYLRKLLWRFFRKPKSSINATKTGTVHGTSKGPTMVRYGNVTVTTNAYDPKNSDDASDRSVLGDGDSSSGVMVSQQFTVHVDSGGPKASVSRSGRW